jgi:hypothetical protein
MTSENKINIYDKLSALAQLGLLIVAAFGIPFTLFQLDIYNRQLSEQIKMNSPILSFGTLSCSPVLFSNSLLKTQFNYNFTLGNEGNTPLLFTFRISSDNLMFKLKNSMDCIEFTHDCQFGIKRGNLIEGGLIHSIASKEKKTFEYIIEIPANAKSVDYQIQVIDASDVNNVKPYTFQCNYTLNKTEEGFKIFTLNEYL